MKTINTSKKVYPLSLSLGLIAAAVILSFVDLMFLNDVIGKVLDIGLTESMVIAFALGMIGIITMFHQGSKVAHNDSTAWSSLGHYSLWLFLGLAFVTVRLFSASILQLDNEAGDEALLPLLGLSVREVDVVVAPLMMLLYIATGIMVKDGAKQLYLNPDFAKWVDDRKKTRQDRKTKEEKRRERAEREQQERLEKMRKEQEEAIANARDEKEAFHRSRTYGEARKRYNEKLEEIKANYQKISTNIDYVKTIDKQEAQFEARTKPNLMSIVQGSAEGVQNSIALAIRAKTNEDIQQLRAEINAHNTRRH